MFIIAIIFIVFILTTIIDLGGGKYIIRALLMYILK